MAIYVYVSFIQLSNYIYIYISIDIYIYTPYPTLSPISPSWFVAPGGIPGGVFVPLLRGGDSRTAVQGQLMSQRGSPVDVMSTLVYNGLYRNIIYIYIYITYD